MKFKLILLVCFSILFLLPAGAASSRKPVEKRQRLVAVTFDDLPSPERLDVQSLETLTRNLLKTFTQYKIPVVGFVNEGKLEVENEKAARTRVLKLWTEAGFELGNHTYSHPYFFKKPLAEFEENVIKGEPVTRQLVTEHGMRLRYFRHPFLSTGPDAATRAAFEKFLTERGYTVAPVTIDNSDWLFAGVYADAQKRGDTETMQRVAEAYVPYLERVFEFHEKLSRDVVGYELRQILLLHANSLNADHFGKVAEMMKRRGYQFISLEEALQDKAYQLPDTYIGANGISWLQRWAITRGGKYREEPTLPKFVSEKWAWIAEEKLKQEKRYPLNPEP